MDKNVLLHRLRQLQQGDDPEIEHSEADYALLAFINDEEVTNEYGKIYKWYA